MPNSRWSPEVEEAIRRASYSYGVPPDLIKAVIAQESSGDPLSLGEEVQGKGRAQGLMQLMPATARALEVDDPFDPYENVRGGAELLRELYDRKDVDNWFEALQMYESNPKAVNAGYQSGYPVEVLTRLDPAVRHLDNNRFEERYAAFQENPAYFNQLSEQPLVAPPDPYGTLNPTDPASLLVSLGTLPESVVSPPLLDTESSGIIPPDTEDNIRSMLGLPSPFDTPQAPPGEVEIFRSEEARKRYEAGSTQVGDQPMSIVPSVERDPGIWNQPFWGDSTGHGRPGYASAIDNIRSFLGLSPLYEEDLTTSEEDRRRFRSNVGIEDVEEGDIHLPDREIPQFKDSVTVSAPLLSDEEAEDVMSTEVDLGLLTPSQQAGVFETIESRRDPLTWTGILGEVLASGGNTMALRTAQARAAGGLLGRITGLTPMGGVALATAGIVPAGARYRATTAPVNIEGGPSVRVTGYKIPGPAGMGQIESVATGPVPEMLSSTAEAFGGEALGHGLGSLIGGETARMGREAAQRSMGWPTGYTDEFPHKWYRPEYQKRPQPSLGNWMEEFGKRPEPTEWERTHPRVDHSANEFGQHRTVITPAGGDITVGEQLKGAVGDAVRSVRDFFYPAETAATATGPLTRGGTDQAFRDVGSLRYPLSGLPPDEAYVRDRLQSKITEMAARPAIEKMLGPEVLNSPITQDALIKQIEQHSIWQNASRLEKAEYADAVTFIRRHLEEGAPVPLDIKAQHVVSVPVNIDQLVSPSLLEAYGFATPEGKLDHRAWIEAFGRGTDEFIPGSSGAGVVRGPELSPIQKGLLEEADAEIVKRVEKHATYGKGFDEPVRLEYRKLVANETTDGSFVPSTSWGGSGVQGAGPDLNWQPGMPQTPTSLWMSGDEYGSQSFAELWKRLQVLNRQANAAYNPRARFFAAGRKGSTQGAKILGDSIRALLDERVTAVHPGGAELAKWQATRQATQDLIRLMDYKKEQTGVTDRIWRARDLVGPAAYITGTGAALASAGITDPSTLGAIAGGGALMRAILGLGHPQTQEHLGRGLLGVVDLLQHVNPADLVRMYMLYPPVRGEDDQWKHPLYTPAEFDESVTVTAPSPITAIPPPGPDASAFQRDIYRAQQRSRGAGATTEASLGRLP